MLFERAAQQLPCVYVQGSAKPAAVQERRLKLALSDALTHCRRWPCRHTHVLLSKSHLCRTKDSLVARINSCVMYGRHSNTIRAVQSKAASLPEQKCMYVCKTASRAAAIRFSDHLAFHSENRCLEDCLLHARDHNPFPPVIRLTRTITAEESHSTSSNKKYSVQS